MTKCVLERRAYPPGEHGRRQIKLTDYALRLNEKQKLRHIYGILEKQLKNYFRRAQKEEGITGQNLIRLLERRLDNVVFRFGFASTRFEARQIVRHGHILVNDKKIDIPSYLIRIGDVIRIKNSSPGVIEKIKECVSFSKERGLPSWLELDESNLVGIVKSFPMREEIPVPVQEQLIVEFYSK